MKAQRDIGFVGAGRITRIFLEGWDRAGTLAGAAVTVSDPDESARASLARRFPDVAVVAENTAAAGARIMFLAVHPPVVSRVLPEIAAALDADSVLVSLVPKFRIAKLSELLGGFGRIVRVIPNAPSIVGAGYNPMTFASALSDEDRARVRGLLAPLGAAPEVAEELLEVYAVVSAMGPTYFWYQFYLLQELAREFGLSNDAAREAVTAMLEGAVRTMAGSGLSAEEVMDLIPVKPLADLEPTVTERMRTALTGLMNKLRA